MKLSRSDLKSIVKECLVEILSEGVGSSLLEGKTKQAKRVTEAARPQQRRLDPVLDTPASAKISTGNAIFDDILADTAKTTLPSMLHAENSRQQPVAAGSIERLVESSTPDELFGDDVSSKWADLAFLSPQRKS